MNTGSIVILVIILALCGLALWRVHKRGVPCECGGNRSCGGCCAGCTGRSCSSRRSRPGK